MLAFARRLPELFTHNLCPLPAPKQTTLPADDKADEEGAAGGDNTAEEAASTAAAKKGAGGNLNKAQKKKRKKAALAAASSKAMDMRMDASLAEPANWPRLALVANSQLRLFVSRCDPSVEVATDAER